MNFALEENGADRFNDEIDAEGEALGRDFRMYTGTGIYYRKKLILKKIFDPSIIFYLSGRKCRFSAHLLLRKR